MKTPRHAYIYGLKDPRDGQIHYVGKSNYPERRKREHLEDKHCNMQRVEWLNDLQEAGLEPDLVVLAKVLVAEWRAAEVYWIARGHEAGWPLVNVHKGGNGGYHKPKPPDYAFMRSYVHPDRWDRFSSMSIGEKDRVCLETAGAMADVEQIVIGIDKQRHYIDRGRVNDMLVYIGQAVSSRLVSNGEWQIP